MKVAIVAVTSSGEQLADRIGAGLNDCLRIGRQDGVRAAFEQAWQHCRGIVMVGAAGIAVRCISGLLVGKYVDPCVVVVDEQGRYAISLLSGHLGGGNRLASEIAALIGAEAVITTASDLSGHTALDLWAVEQNYTIADPAQLASTAARLLERGSLRIFRSAGLTSPVPPDLEEVREPEQADIVVSVTPRIRPGQLLLIPRIHYLGFGCRAGVPEAEFEAVLEQLWQNGLEPASIAAVASIDLKRQEPGLIGVAAKRKWPMRFFSREQLNQVAAAEPSSRVFEKIGAYSVSEAAALLAAASGGHSSRLIIRKRKWKQITAAVAVRDD